MAKHAYIFLILILFAQLIFSFAFPSVGSNDSWLPISAYLPKASLESQDATLLNYSQLLISPEYRINSDVGGYIELAKNFTPEFFEGNPYLNRPLYPLLIFILSSVPSFLISSSYSIVFGSAIIINFLLILGTVLLFFNLLKKFFSFKVAFLSSLLLILSPFVHSFLAQPMPEMLTAFTVMLSLYLLYKYIYTPSTFRLLLYSFVIGVFMLGKMFFAIPLFVLFLAYYYKRFREGAVFLAMLAIPLIAWYIWITRVWGIPYYVHEVEQWHMGIWLANVYVWPWQETLRLLVAALPNFISAAIHAFILIPIIFAAIGARYFQKQIKKTFTYGFISSIFLLAFLINLYLYRHAFMLFPIIYPAAILGIESVANYLKKYDQWYPVIFYSAAIALIIAISNINIYKVFYYLN